MEKCTICGSSHYEAFSFKGGHICEDCLNFIRIVPKDAAPKYKDKR